MGKGNFSVEVPMISQLLKAIANKTSEAPKDAKEVKEAELREHQRLSARLANVNAREFREEMQKGQQIKLKAETLLTRMQRGVASKEDIEELEKIAHSPNGSEDMRLTVQALKQKKYAFLQNLSSE